jgi:hypothetical protein
MILASLCAIFLAMLFIRLGALTVMVIFLAAILKVLALLTLIFTGLFCWKRMTRRYR